MTTPGLGDRVGGEARPRLQPGDVGEVDDAAEAAPRPWPGAAAWAQKKGALQVDREGAVDLLLGGLREGGREEVGGRVHQHVHAAQGRLRPRPPRAGSPRPTPRSPADDHGAHPARAARRPPSRSAGVRRGAVVDGHVEAHVGQLQRERAGPTRTAPPVTSARRPARGEVTPVPSSAAMPPGGPAAMGDRRLLRRGSSRPSSGCSPSGRNSGVVAEAARARASPARSCPSRSPHDHQHAVAAAPRPDEHADEGRAAVLHALQLLQQAAAVVGVGGVRPGVARS